MHAPSLMTSPPPPPHFCIDNHGVINLSLAAQPCAPLATPRSLPVLWTLGISQCDSSFSSLCLILAVPSKQEDHTRRVVDKGSQATVQASVSVSVSRWWWVCESREVCSAVASLV